jgi:P-type E1-E2 ATPase
VPADVSVFQATDLQCDESLLTGESAPMKKIIPPGQENAVPAFAGTLVTRGRGRGVVVATGMSSEIGKIAAELGKKSSAKPPLMIRLAKFSNLIAWLVGFAMLFLILVGLIRGLAWGDLFLMAVGLAVSAIPEGLPVAISVALAISMRRMARENVIVRRMPAVEALGLLHDDRNRQDRHAHPERTDGDGYRASRRQPFRVRDGKRDRCLPNPRRCRTRRLGKRPCLPSFQGSINAQRRRADP